MKDQKIAVVGAGLMGVGIATQYLLAGYTVALYDIDAGRLREAGEMARNNLDELVEAGVLGCIERDGLLEHLVATSSLDDLVNASVVFEAVPEILSIKQDVYEAIESNVLPSTIIASNTSGFDPGTLCETMRHPERFLVAHFWNPPYLLPLVELVPSENTEARHIVFMNEQLKSVRLNPIVLKKSIAGFIGNRVQFAILREVLHILRMGIATPTEIDSVVQMTLGRRYQFAGPLASADLGGLNTLSEVAKHLMPELAKDESVIELLRDHVNRGELGVRSGSGFHQWTAELRERVKADRRKLLQAGWK